MRKEAREELSVRFKLTVLEQAIHLGATKACWEFNVPRSTFYRWKQNYEDAGRAGLNRQKPVTYSHPRKTPPEVVAKIRALQVYSKHNQAYAIQFVDYVIERFPFRISTVKTDRGH